MKREKLLDEVGRRVDKEKDTYYPGQGLVDWLAEADDRGLWRINAYAAADALVVDRRRLLGTMIRLVRDGVFDLNWDFHCTHCNAVAGSHRHLKEAMETISGWVQDAGEKRDLWEGQSRAER